MAGGSRPPVTFILSYLPSPFLPERQGKSGSSASRHLSLGETCEGQEALRPSRDAFLADTLGCHFTDNALEMKGKEAGYGLALNLPQNSPMRSITSVARHPRGHFCMKEQRPYSLGLIPHEPSPLHQCFGICIHNWHFQNRCHWMWNAGGGGG